MRYTTPDPFREFERLLRPQDSGVDYDVIRHEDRLDLRFDLPGVDPDGIELTVDGRELVLSAERRFDVPAEAKVVRAGRRYGKITRRLFLGDSLDTTALSADYVHGVLHVTIPYAAEAKPRRVSIGVGADNATHTAISA